MGTVGSLRCIGMCGPLALALPVRHPGDAERLTGGALYNLGRVTTYASSGPILGLAGQVFLSGKTQQTLSIVLGAGILIYLLVPIGFRASSAVVSVANKPFLILRHALAGLFQSHKYTSLYLIGALNGLLPCGLVYLAISASFLTGNALKGSLFMAFLALVHCRQCLLLCSLETI